MATQEQQVTEALAGSYDVERKLGVGGMATVFLARDAKHGRHVAIKVLHPELAASLGADRFLREIEIAAGLSHPHILPLHDSGEVGGFLFYVMPYVEGESLAARLEREKHLAVNDALRIISETGDGLAYAHERGVIHRDIKPDNVLLSAGHAVIADFGIARAIRSAEAEQLTQTGLAIGTPAYMSPEQASGDSELDARSDQYSLACVLYEILAGQPPFVGRTPQAVMARHAVDPVPPVKTVRSTVPDNVDAILHKALAKVPADRFPTVREFIGALTDEHVTVVSPVVETPVAKVSDSSIAVLPFTNMSADSENEYFCDGMAEEIINALVQVPTLDVSARTSSFAFKGQNLPVKEVGQQLGVGTIVEGSVRKAGNHLRITAQLINTADGYHLWSERFDRELEDVFAIQDEIAAAIVHNLKLTLTGDQPVPRINRGTENPEAYDIYLKGRHFWHLRNISQAIEAFKQAIAVDPGFALAHLGLADSITLLGHFGFMPANLAHQQASEAVGRACSFDADLPEAFCTLGTINLFFQADLDKGERQLREALSRDPRLTDARTMLILTLAVLNKPDAMRDQKERGLELEPRSAYLRRGIALAHFMLGETEPAVAEAERAVEMEPYSAPALLVFGWCLQLAGRVSEAITIMDRAAELSQRAPLMIMSLGIAYAQHGDREGASGVLQQMRERATQSYVPPGFIGAVVAAMGDLDEAKPLIATGFEDKTSYVPLLALWPGLQGLQNDPDYIRQLAERGLTVLAGRSPRVPAAAPPG